MCTSIAVVGDPANASGNPIKLSCWVVGKVMDMSYVHTREHFCSNRLQQPAPRCLSPALRCFPPHLGAFLLHSGAPSRTSVPFSCSPVLSLFAFRCPTILVFFALRCPILLTPPLAPGGKMAGNAGDVIVSEEHCTLLDQVQAGC